MVPAAAGDRPARSWKTWSVAWSSRSRGPRRRACPSRTSRSAAPRTPCPEPPPAARSIRSSGASPQQLEAAYGLNQISFAGIKGDGAGQTVAIVNAYDNPAFLDTSDPNFATSALAVYDKTFGLPDPPSFTKFNEYGDTAYSSLAPPSAPGGWSVEIALDIEAVHAMAPAAGIDLVEGDTNYNADLFQAEQTAAALPGVSAVSNSWGEREYAGASVYDNVMMAQGVTFLASSGDYGGARHRAARRR